MEKKIIGIDLGGTSIKFAIISLAGEVQQKWSIPTNILDEGSHICGRHYRFNSSSFRLIRTNK